MSYAIESKKRKWDRLLESFNDRSPAHPSTATPQRTSAISLIPTFEEELAKKRRLEASTLSLGRNSTTISLVSNYLPSNRTAFLERLETFRSVTKWHIPSTEPINAAEWAKRGWRCLDTDTVSCGMCGERVFVKVDVEEDVHKDNEVTEDSEPDTSQVVEDDDSYSAAVEIYDGVIGKFTEMIETAHEDGCQWKRRGCDASIQRIEGLLNTSKAISGLRTRYDGLMLNESKIPDTQLLSKRGDDAEKELRCFQFVGVPSPDYNALRLAICGWQIKSEDVFECHNCFRSLGLWLYRGEYPAMERLDAIESHLEYCPWRASGAQQTEIAAPAEDGDGGQTGTEKVAGWQLVCQAVKVDNARRRRKTLEVDESRPSSAVSGKAASTDTVVDDTLSPEQREKRMKGLLKRINAIKQPFNVKSLLKRRKETKA